MPQDGVARGDAQEPEIVAEAAALIDSAGGRFAAAVYGLAAIAAGFALWAAVRMWGDAAVGELILLIAVAWLAWTAAVALRLWAAHGAGIEAMLHADEPVMMPGVAL